MLIKELLEIFIKQTSYIEYQTQRFLSIEDLFYYMMKALQYGLGISLIIIGIAGLFLPVLQGVLFILAGVVVLREENVKTATNKLRGYFKKKSVVMKQKIPQTF